MPTKPTRRKTAAPRPPRPDAKVDPMSIEPELREYIVRRNEVARKRAIAVLIPEADAYRAELGRTDNLHTARLDQREDGVMLAAEDLLATKRPFSNLTHADLDFYWRGMEAGAGEGVPNP